MADIKHWADVAADKAMEHGQKHLVATGITPSGHIHIGNMREVVTADAVYRALLDKDQNAELIYIADTYDPLRKVYPFLPDSYSEHIGKPLSEIPCPCGNCENYAQHFLTPFLESLSKMGIHPKVYKGDELYKSGAYTDAIKTALLNRDKISRIIEEETGKDPDPEWSPFNPICNVCGRINTTKVVDYDIENETVDFVCSNGHSGTVSMTGGGKLSWRVDWPARWQILGVTVEPFGKDHASRGGSYDTGERIAKEIYGYEPPYPVVYEWIMLGKQGAMSSSSGVVVTISDMLKVVPPEVLRYLIIKTKPEKHISFEPGMPLLTLVDEFERLKSSDDIDDANKRVLELSHASGICHTDIPFKHMVTVYQVARGDFDQIIQILKRAGYDTENEKCIRGLVSNVENWLEMYAPDFVKFSVKEKLPEKAANLSDEQKAFLGALSEVIEESGHLSGEEYHNIVYQAKEKDSKIHKKMADILGINPDELEPNPKNLFKAIYITILGQKSGPKAGWFLSSFDKDFLIERFKEASTYSP
ncbi:lysyl-tRNA synthetase [Methanohalobium evestigatum Z-7303]|uniref:Lysine--tRNA ligase n=1 Tax=Methanohalobium evestigatum (strain ATCC BAA-1072 / DSM 3721 / NBRC 107634 / OCM 161 / Z-7303) TaxID=644295 RepID=D7EBB0_METEZ|nr:lysine--tRNA ligase [Methanohalobium evestigatum]ADI74627.1 lysyl-tRNA synthetase [Methanohalobium evestigatum Z-7303]